MDQSQAEALEHSVFLPITHGDDVLMKAFRHPFGFPVPHDVDSIHRHEIVKDRLYRRFMTIASFLLISFAAAALIVHLVSCFLAHQRFRKSSCDRTSPVRPAFSVIRPLCGIEQFSAETLRSSFNLNYPQYEVIFCVADKDDPVLPLVRSLIAAHPDHLASVLIGDDKISSNPKLNNMAKGFHASLFDHLVFVDSNVFMPAHYLDELAVLLQEGAGMVSAPPIGLGPEGFWAELECAFLNSYQARIQYSLDLMGLGFAQGKTLCFRRADLERGGFARLASEPAEDAAATKLMRQKRMGIRLAGPFPQLIGSRSLSQVWNRQVRWARLRCASFPALYVPEILAGGIPPLLALCLATEVHSAAGAVLAVMFSTAWYVPELLLIRAARWPGALPTLLMRDALLPAVYVAGLLGRNFEWHGHRMIATRNEEKPRWRLSARLNKLRGSR